MVIGVRCEVGKGGEWEDGGGGGHSLRGVDYRNYKDEGLLDEDGQWWGGRMRTREHTMKLFLDDVMRVLEWLMLRGEWIGGVKELIYSILHDSPKLAREHSKFIALQNTPKHNPSVTCIILSLSLPAPCSIHIPDGGKAVRPPLFLPSFSFSDKPKKNSQSCRSQRNLHPCKCAHNYKVNKGRPHH